MKAIILAAGMGTRISRFIDECPKCMVDIGGTSLIKYTVRLLRQKGVGEITVAVGYKADMIKDELKDEDVSFAFNPFYDVTNGIASMWFAKDHLTYEETIIMSGDVYVEPEIIDKLIKTTDDPVLLADSSRIIEADYRYNYENGVLKKFGKDLSIADTTGECLGIAKLGKDFVKVYKDHMIEMINGQIHSVWWESVLYDLSSTTDIYINDIAGCFWAEVDYVEDYKRILAHRKEKGMLNI
ncbi:MAG: phosphocholine cytidylyltransferase family protein [Clostridia bacterium]|nr:phosphocholine cytidylyltransferase family protein [Clostridia bacterium]